MAANVSPIYSRLGDIQWIDTVLAANTTTDLTAGTNYLIFTSDATNGGRVDKLRATALGTNIATVLRIWLNNGSTTATLANNTLYFENTMPSTAVSQVAALAAVEIYLGIALPAGYKLYATLGTAVAAGFDITAVAGKY